MDNEQTEKLVLNQDLERQILAFSLVNRGFFLNLTGYLKGSHFNNKLYANVWMFIQKYFEKYTNVPTASVILQKFKQNNVPLDYETFETELTDVKQDISKWLEEQVIKQVREQEFKKFIFRAADEAGKESPDYAMLEGQFKDILNIQTEIDFGTDYFDAKGRYAKIIQNVAEKIPLGLKSLDDVLYGGVTGKELYCFLAPPGVGKSLFLTYIGKNLLLQRKNVVHYTLEMSAERVSMRYDAAMLNMATNELIGNVDDVIAKIDQRRKVLNNNLFIKEFPPDGANVNHLRSHLQKLREYKGFVPDVILLDYGDILAPTGKHTERYEKQGAAFIELRGLAVETNLPIITATQTNRDALNKEIITYKDIGDSFDKARTVEFLAAIMQKPEERAENRCRVYIAKNRNGTAGQLFGFEIDYARNQIVDKGALDTQE